MSKILSLDVNQFLEAMSQQVAEDVFQQAVGVVEKHGVCYFRFTKEDGMVIIHPRFNSKLNGVISDA